MQPAGLSQAVAVEGLPGAQHGREKPMMLINFAAPNLTSLDAIFENCMPIPECGCWVWMGMLSPKGYGEASGRRIGRKRRHHIRVARLAYELKHGEIPAGRVLRHNCRVRPCCNPDHFRPVTTRQNLLLGANLIADNFRKTHCPQGHPLSGENLCITKAKRRTCRTCHRERARARASRHDQEKQK